MSNVLERVEAEAASPMLAVIGAGFGRTGTLSLREALVRLGFGPCDHMLENVEHPERFARWNEAFRRKRARKPIDWRPLLGKYRAIVDWPGAYFWRELSTAHPRAKVILTVRDPNRWYESSLATIFQARSRADQSFPARIAVRLLGILIPPLREGFQLVDNVIWNGTFAGRFADRAHALRVFTMHNQEVEKSIPAERLLVFDVTQGWEPLCVFLEVPVPDGVPFPHVNDAESFQKRIRERLPLVLAKLARPIVAVTAVLVALTWSVRRIRHERKADS